MPLITYIRNIPDPPHNPSTDVPDMQHNTNAIDDIIAVDHLSFNDANNNSGFHKQSRYVNFTPLSSPATNVGQLALYSEGNLAGPSQLFMVRDNNAGTRVALTPNPTAIGNMSRTQTGFSWLPGNVLLQWGLTAIGAGPANTPVVFLVPFTFPLDFVPVVTITQIGNTGSNDTTMVLPGSVTNTQFIVHNNNSAITFIFWMAIGPI